jgi:hypothetical protein
VHDDDVLGTAARGMFRQSEGRQRPLVDGAVIGDDELSLRQRMGPGVPATAASTRAARVNVSSRAENTYAVSPTTLLARCGCRLAIRCCASCRCPRSHHGVEGWAGAVAACFLEASATAATPNAGKTCFLPTIALLICAALAQSHRYTSSRIATTFRSQSVN